MNDIGDNPTHPDIEAAIRSVLGQHARLPIDAASLAVESDLYAAGMSSHASVNVMLGLEAAFDLEFPDTMLKRSVFQSIASIRDAVLQLTASQTA